MTRVAIVTGTSRVTGRATAVRLARDTVRNRMMKSRWSVSAQPERVDLSNSISLPLAMLVCRGPQMAAIVSRS